MDYPKGKKIKWICSCKKENIATFHWKGSVIHTKCECGKPKRILNN